MTDTPTFRLRPSLRLGVGLTGLAMLVAAARAAALAGEHMQLLDAICGGAHPHCGWCFAAVGFTAAGLAATGFSATGLAVPSPGLILRKAGDADRA